MLPKNINNIFKIDWITLLLRLTTLFLIMFISIVTLNYYANVNGVKCLVNPSSIYWDDAKDINSEINSAFDGWIVWTEMKYSTFILIIIIVLIKSEYKSNPIKKKRIVRYLWFIIFLYVILAFIILCTSEQCYSWESVFNMFVNTKIVINPNLELDPNYQVVRIEFPDDDRYKLNNNGWDSHGVEYQFNLKCLSWLVLCL